MAGDVFRCGLTGGLDDRSRHQGGLADSRHRASAITSDTIAISKGFPSGQQVVTAGGAVAAAGSGGRDRGGAGQMRAPGDLNRGFRARALAAGVLQRGNGGGAAESSGRCYPPSSQQRDETPFGFAGSIEPKVSAELSFRLLGRVIARATSTWATLVKKGATIATLDLRRCNCRCRQAQRRSLQRGGAIRQRRRQRRAPEGAAGNRRTPRNPSTTGVQARDAAQGQRRTGARRRLPRRRSSSGYAQLFSDFDGVVTETGAEVGQVVIAGTDGGDGGALRCARCRCATFQTRSRSQSHLGSMFTVALQSAPTHHRARTSCAKSRPRPTTPPAPAG